MSAFKQIFTGQISACQVIRKDGRNSGIVAVDQRAGNTAFERGADLIRRGVADENDSAEIVIGDGF